ncbi:hypothetical protein [Halovenus salina]|uniref:Uncharacterized protein n=1 Tax=Halovenus salina TaxID=1510225 RepID=A0ABD5W5G9_9EURY|nr:hypothetical protein [Halovenus salina]
MTTVDVSESLTYGFKLFGYLLAVVILGGGGMALGGALAGPIVLDGTVTEELSSPELLGGAVLGALGLAVWVTGTFGLTYKLLADAVSRGVPEDLGASPSEEESTDQQHASTQPATEPVGPSPGEQTARSFGPESTVPGASDVPDRATSPSDSASTVVTTTDDGTTNSEPEADEATTDTSDQADSVADGPSETEERTAEEIAFGDNDGPDRQPPVDDAVAADVEAGPTPPDESQPADSSATEVTDEATAVSDTAEDDSGFEPTDTEDDSGFEPTDTEDDSGFEPTDIEDDSDFGPTDIEDDSDFEPTDIEDSGPHEGEKDSENADVDVAANAENTFVDAEEFEEETAVDEPTPDDSGTDELFSSETEEVVSAEESAPDEDTADEATLSDDDGEASDTDPLA